MIQWTTQTPDKTGLLQSLLDAMPTPVLLADTALRVNLFNAAARHEFGAEEGRLSMKLVGEVLECLHAVEASGGCGCGARCGDCVIRQAVTSVIGGRKTCRQQATLQVHYGSDVRDLHLLVTADAFEHDGQTLGLLILEDTSELFQLRGLLPICASCRNIRDDEAYRDQIDRHLQSHRDVDFSHGLCPTCREQLDPEVNRHSA